MKSLCFAVLIAFSIVVAAISSGQSTAVQPSAAANAQRVADGAYRDGLFVGKLHRRLGRQEHIIWGRWNSGQDRQSFTEGYSAGYGGTLAR